MIMDNAPGHNHARRVGRDMGISIPDWPAKSPDLKFRKRRMLPEIQAERAMLYPKRFQKLKLTLLPRAHVTLVAVNQ